MSQSLAWWRVTVLAAIVLCIVLAVNASGEQGKSGGTFATVDFQKLTDGFKDKQTVEADINSMRDKYNERLQRRANRPDLPEEEQASLDALYEKGPGKTDADKAKIKELEDKGDRLAGEFRALQEKKDVTDAEKQKLADAAKARAASQEKFTALQDELNNKLREYGAQKEQALMKRIRDAVAKVAEQKGLSIVFRTEVVLYAGTDITQPVTDELNKGK